jgi:HSP20 family protein
VPRIFLERRDLADDLRRLLDQLDDRDGAAGAAGECTPPCDVIERPEAIEVIMDLPGVQADTVTILFARNTVVIAGRKLPTGCGHAEAAFHLAERMFGRFARVIRLTGAFDTGRAHAAVNAGELRLILPRIEERRGREIRIPVRAN